MGEMRLDYTENLAYDDKTCGRDESRMARNTKFTGDGDLHVCLDR